MPGAGPLRRWERGPGRGRCRAASCQRHLQGNSLGLTLTAEGLLRAALGPVLEVPRRESDEDLAGMLVLGIGFCREVGWNRPCIRSIPVPVVL